MKTIEPPRPYKWASTEWLRKEYESLKKEPPVLTTWHEHKPWFGPKQVYPGSMVWGNELFTDSIKIHFELAYRMMHGEPKRPKGWNKATIKVDPRFLLPPL